MSGMRLAVIAATLLGATACDYSGEWLFPDPIEGVPGVVHLGTLEVTTFSVPADEAIPRDELDEAVIYAELGPAEAGVRGGVTANFIGTGGDVCVWVDPELVSWNQSVATSSVGKKEWSYPDNLFDDGDLDLDIGRSVFYNGSPGEEWGTFQAPYEDALGNTVTIDLVECTVVGGLLGLPGAHGGRGSPDYCTVFNTEEGVSYTIALETWSLPIDDARLSYGMIVADRRCSDLKRTVREDSGIGGGVGANVDPRAEECLIRGESVIPDSATGSRAAEAGLPSPSWYGLSELPVWEGTMEFEANFCDPDGDMRKVCKLEAEANLDQDRSCSWEIQPDESTRCFCGDPEETPTAGSF